jgi:hypothetical protein
MYLLSLFLRRCVLRLCRELNGLGNGILERVMVEEGGLLGEHGEAWRVL